jgi:hypothetical protein
VTVTEQAAPNAGTNGTLQICEGETVTAAELFSALGGSPDMGGSWSPTLAGAGTYTYTVSGAPDCPDATAQVTVTEQTPPNAGTNGTLQICQGETVTAAELFSSLGGSPDMGGSWSPTLAGADTYTYTVSGAPDCPDATAQVTVTEQAAPNAGTNGTLQICEGETVTAAELFTALGGTPDGGGSWSPTLAGADTYTYTVSGAPDCPDATAQVTVTEQTPPNAGTNGSLQICAGETVTESELFSSLGGSPDMGGSWSPTLAGADTYTYTVSGAPDCPDATAQVTVTEQAAPNAGTNGTLQICAGETVIESELFSSLGGSPDMGGSWSPTLAGADTYTYTVSGAPDCPDATAQVTVTEQTPPNAGTNGTLQICQGETVTAAELFSSLGGSPDMGGSWSPTLAGADTYTYTVSGAPDCPDATAQVTVTEQTPPNAGTNGSLQICAGETVTAAELFTALGGTPDGGGSWSPTLAGADTYTYTVSGAPDCPDATAQVTVTEQAAPNAGTNGSLQICAGETVTAAELFSALGGSPDMGGSWSPTLAGADTYTYTVSGAPDCPDATAQVTVTEQTPPNAGTNGTLQICAGETVTAAELFSSLGGTPDMGGSWSPALAGAGTYTYTVSGAPDCPDATAQVTVTTRPLPTATISGTTTTCLNAVSPDITIANPGSDAVTVTYQINGGGSLTVDLPGNSSTDISVPTSSGGVFTYALQDVSYQDMPICTTPLSASATVTVTDIDIRLLGNGIEIVNGDNSPSTGDDTDFGSVLIGDTETRTFTIENLGGQSLNITSPLTLSDNLVGFSVTQPVTTVVGGLSSTTFTVSYSPNSVLDQTVIVTIPNDDCDEAPYTFTVTGGTDCEFISASLSGDQSICANSNGILDIDISGGTPPYEVTLSDGNSYPVSSSGSQTITVSPSSTTTYSISSVTDAGGCGALSLSGSATVTVLSCSITNDNDNPGTDPALTDPCICLDNATSLTDGQFSELITVLNAPPGGSWEVLSVSGLYLTSSASPPVAPTLIPIGTPLTEVSVDAVSSNYELSGIHVDAEGYSITVWDGGSNILSITNTCFYPNPTIDNVADLYCKTTSTFAPQGSALLGDNSGPAGKESAAFSLYRLPDNALVATGPEGSFMLNFSTLPPGSYRLVYTFDALDDDPDQQHPGCVQRVEQSFTIQNVNCGTFPWDGN